MVYYLTCSTKHSMTLATLDMHDLDSFVFARACSTFSHYNLSMRDLVESPGLTLIRREWGPSRPPHIPPTLKESRKLPRIDENFNTSSKIFVLLTHTRSFSSTSVAMALVAAMAAVADYRLCTVTKVGLWVP